MPGLCPYSPGPVSTPSIVSPGWPDPRNDPEITVESTGIEVGEIIAWRAWRIKDGVLKSLSMDTFWLPGETVEGDLNGPGEYGHRPGIYSFKKASAAWEFAGAADVGARICGQVALWGEVVEHEEGYRAENARVHSLDYIRPETPENEVMLDKLRHRYGLADVDHAKAKGRAG